jgi:uncharacterized protein (DUF2225 family)
MGLDDKLVRKKLEVLLKDEMLVQKYLRVYGPKLDMNNINKLKQDQLKTGSPEGASGDQNDPIYIIKIKCPVCSQAELACHELKAKSLTANLDKFLVPRYVGVKPFRTVNYTLMAVTVCPSCLFASPDKKDFLTFSVQARTENKSQLTPFVLEDLRKKVDERKALINTPDFAAYFQHPRGVESAIASYRLCIHRAMVEASLETPLAWYKAGMYSLKIALLLRDGGKDDEAVLKDASGYLSKSFQQSELKNPEMEYQLLYLICALYLRLGDQAQCQNYMGVLDKLKSELTKAAKDDPKITTAHVDRWLDKAKEMWTDREIPDLWKH